MDEGAYPSDMIEGDYVETMEGLLFTVKGLFHPEGRIIAYLRYVPDSGGDRIRNGQGYTRVYDLEETMGFLIERFPHYISHVDRIGLTLQTVPYDKVARIYRPRQRLKDLLSNPKNKLEETVAMFVSALSSESGVTLENFGVSGSLLIDLASSDSDIDLAVYGRDAGEKVYAALGVLRETRVWITPYDEVSVGGVLRARWKGSGLDLDKLRGIEIGKLLHGLVQGREYFVRLIKKPEEAEAENSSTPLGEVKLRAVVSEAGESIFTPCRYRVGECVLLGTSHDEKVSELVSFRGRFTEQARERNTVYARGTLEEVEYGDRTIHRVMLGSREDYLVPFEV